MACTNNSTVETEIYNEKLHINKRDLSPLVEYQEYCERIDIKKEPENNTVNHVPYIDNRNIHLLEGVCNTVSSNSCDKEAYHVVKEENLETVINTEVDLSFENNLVSIQKVDCDTRDLLEGVCNTVSSNLYDKEAYHIVKEENLETVINNDFGISFENNLVPIKEVDCNTRDINPSYALQEFCKTFDMTEEPLADTIMDLNTKRTGLTEAVKVDHKFPKDLTETISNNLYNNEDCSDRDNSTSSYSFELVTCKMEEESDNNLIDENISSPDSAVKKDDHRYACKDCTKAFKTKSALAQHRYKHTHTKSYVCDTCSKGFYFKSHLELHKLTHTGEKPHACDVCNNGFTSKKYLEYHRRIHTGEKTHVCSICNKGFNRYYALKLHQLTHTDQKNYVCDVCDKAFTVKRGLNKHKIIHSEGQLYVCEICNKAFRRLDSLNRHKLIHTDKYVCEICNRAFGRLAHLNQHIPLHTGDKSHVCDVCNKAFVQLSTLYKHKLTHTGDKQGRQIGEAVEQPPQEPT